MERLTQPAGMEGDDSPYLPRPSQMPEYRLAQTEGRIAPVPATPPRLLPGTSSRRLFIRSVVAFFGTLLFAIVGLKAANGHPPLFTLVGVLSLGLLAGAVQLLRSSQRRQFDEIAHGYTHDTSQFGMVTLRNWRKVKIWGDWQEDPKAGIPWDFSGLWRLSEDGRVLAEPKFSAEPPGFYPSPHKADKYEFWTGCAWSRVFRR
jgi:hypothetical protein